jgi:TIGR03009 family protein
VVQQVPGPFQLNVLQQGALDQVLDAWQKSSGNISTFQCSFERWEYNVAFGPGKDIPLNKNKGKLTYQKPDKGSIEISEINAFRQAPAQPGQQPGAAVQADWVAQPGAIGEHWVCDGKSVYEYRANQKQVVEHPIPPALQGQAIADGPLPFLFGADATKLKARYWMKLDESNSNPAQIWIIAQPKFQQQAADFKEVDVILDKEKLLPQYMQVWMPNGDHHVYIFDMKSVQTNNLFGRLQGFFARPSVPFGWKHVVQAAALQQAAQPVPPPR